MAPAAQQKPRASSEQGGRMEAGLVRLEASLDAAQDAAKALRRDVSRGSRDIAKNVEAMTSSPAAAPPKPAARSRQAPGRAEKCALRLAPFLGDGHQHHRHRRAGERLPDHSGAPWCDRLAPAEDDEIGAGLVDDACDLLARHADP